MSISYLDYSPNLLPDQGMALTSEIEAQRLANLQQRQRLLAELNLDHATTSRRKAKTLAREEQPATKKRRSNISHVVPANPARTSARIASSGTRISYTEERNPGNTETSSRIKIKNERKRQSRASPFARKQVSSPPKAQSLPLPTDLPSLIQHYNSWTPSASPPTLDIETSAYHFASHPHFTPNKSPLSILLEGAFGGHYFAPWRPRSLSTTLENDFLATLPADWLAQLHPHDRHITSAGYKPELNRHGVACGQTFAQWEDAGWINFAHDARGWFEWYVRFWLGRRLRDGEDERQVGRWVRCVGPKGRWKRVLLKKYVESGVTSVFDDEDEGVGGGMEEEEDGEKKVSPVIHQTCLHWAYQVTQEDLDEAWREWRG